MRSPSFECVLGLAIALLLGAGVSACSCAEPVSPDAGVRDVPPSLDAPVTDARVTDARVADAPVADAVDDARALDVPVESDAPTRDTPGLSDAPATDAGACACTAASCGTRVCGRSACGFPCGTCDGTQWCGPGGTCRPGSPPVPVCTDAFSLPGFGAVSYGDRGLRRCPTDPSMVEECTCSTGGPDSWMDCTGTCFTPCLGHTRCGGGTCTPLEYCEACGAAGAPTTFTCRPRSEVPGCARAGLDLFALCDSDEDCGPLDACMAVRGDFVRLSCEPGTTTPQCGAGAFYLATCDALSDCPTCATTCEEVTFADTTTPSGTGIRVCR